MATNLEQASLFLVDTVIGLYVIVMMLRAILEATRADFYNPISQFIWQATQPVLTLPERLIPRWRNFNIAAITVIVLLCFINIQLALFIVDYLAGPGQVLLWTVCKAAVLLINLYFFAILIQVIMSWVSPGVHSPATALLWRITEPLLRPFREMVPPIGGLDISPLFVLIGLQLINMLLPLPAILR